MAVKQTLTEEKKGWGAVHRNINKLEGQDVSHTHDAKKPPLCLNNVTNALTLHHSSQTSHTTGRHVFHNLHSTAVWEEQEANSISTKPEKVSK